MAKDAEDRFDDTVKYIRDNGMAELAQHVELTTTTQSNKDNIGGDLSLGGVRLWKDDEKTQQRRALRALLLCQRVYFSAMWAQMFFKDEVAGGTSEKPPVADDQEPPFSTQVPPVHADRWPKTSPSWEATKTASVLEWKDKTAPHILEAIRTFAITSIDKGSLVAAAQDPGDPAQPMVSCKLTRTTSPFPISTFCWPAVMFWLLKSGLVSYRWMLKFDGAPPSKLRQVFGKGEIVWSSARAFTKDDQFPHVDAGKIVHLYVNSEYQFGGHWLVSDGNGRAYGRNNDDSMGELRPYALCDLKTQYLGGYKKKYAGKELLMEGIAEVIDPTTMTSKI